jgi:putative FmdB family regulatory protein
MPIYEYQCAQCGERFEVLHPMGDDGSKLSCPKCNAQSPKSLFSSFSNLGSSTSEVSETSSPTCNTNICGLTQISKY